MIETQTALPDAAAALVRLRRGLCKR